MWLKLHIFFVMLFFGVCVSYGQDSKEDVEKEARKHFRNEEFIEATPLYLKLISLEPRNPNYNYRYGTCLLFNSDEKKKAFKYLNYAVSKSQEVEDEAYYYLGKAFHLTFQFDKAIENYKIYKSKAGSNALSKLDVDRQIEMCKNGKSLMANISETVVLNKQLIGKDNFFRIYDLQNIGGELIVTEEFQNKQDKKNGHIPLIHFPANSNVIFYSSYGDDGDNKDIYRRRRLPDGSWSLEQRVLGNVNTRYDEDYPYMHPSGKYLYFCSKGHNSMGGYDVFRSIYDPESNAFGEPENMDISISSPDNDFLYIVDSLDKYAYFASQRESEADKVHVYSVRVERFPIQMVILKGTFSSTLDPSETDLEIQITSVNGEDMGTFRTTPKGEYLINLPKGGEYEFKMNVAGKEETYKQTVDLPYLKEFRPLKQKITETTQDNKEVVIIENLFDEEFENPEAILAEAIAQKSKMEVNKENFDLDSLDNLREQRKLLAEVGLENYTNQEIIDMVNRKVEDLTERANTTREEIQKAKTVLATGNDYIQDKLNEADSLADLANNSTNKEERELLLKRSKRALMDAERKKDAMNNARVLLDFLEEDLKETEDKLYKAKALNNELKDLDLSDGEALLSHLNKHKDFVSSELTEETLLDPKFEYLTQIEEKLSQLEKVEIRKRQLENQRKEKENEIAELKKKLEDAPRRKKDDIQMEITSAENALADINNEIDYATNQLKEKEQLEDQASVVNDVSNTVAQEDLPSDEEIRSTTENLDQTYNEQNTTTEKIAKENDIDLSETSDIASEENETTSSENESSSDIVSQVDPNYKQDIKELEEKVNNGEATKEELKERKEEAQEKTQQELNNVQNDIAENGANEQNTKKAEALENAVAQLDEEIKDLEEESTSTPTMTSDEAIAQADPDYEQDIKDLEEKVNNGEATKQELKERKEEAQEKTQQELNNVQNDIAENGANEENTKKAEALENAVAQLDEEIKNLEEETTITPTMTSDEAIAQADPDYEQDIKDLEEKVNNGEATKQELKERKEEAQEKTQQELNNVQNDIAENGATEEKTKKAEALENAVAQLEEEIKNLEEESTSTPTMTSDEAIAQADPDYEQDIKDLEEKVNNGEATKQDLKERKEEAQEKAQQELNNVQNDIAENGANEENTKKAEALENAVAQLDEEIKNLEEETTTTPTMTSDEAIAQADPDYEQDIKDLEEKVNNGKATKQELKERKEEAQEKAQQKLNNVQNDIAKNGANEENTKKAEALENAVAQLDEEIKNLEEESTSTPTLTSDEAIAQADPDYEQDIKDLEEKVNNGEATKQELKERKEEAQEKTQQELNNVQNDIAKNGANEENTKKAEALENAVAQLDKEIKNLEEESTSTPTMTSDEAIAQADPDYEQDIKDLEEKVNNGEATKQELKERKEEAQEKTQQELNNVQNDIAKNGANEENTKKAEALENAVAQLDKEIKNLEEESTSTPTMTSDEAIAQADPDYEQDIKDLEEKVNNGEATKQELKERKEEAQEKTQQELNNVQNDIAENGATEENTKKAEALENAVAQLDEEIKQLNEDTEETISVNEADLAEVRNEVDKGYEKDMAALTEKYLNDEITEEEIIERKEEYLDALNKSIEDTQNELADRPEDTELQKKATALEREKKKVLIEIGDLTQAKDNKTSITAEQRENIEKAAGITQKEKNQLANEPSSEKEAQAQIDILDRMIQTAKEMKDTTSNVTDKKAIADNIKELENKKRQASFTFGEVEQSTMASLNDDVRSSMSEKEIEDLQEKEEEINELKSEREQLEEEKNNASSNRDKEKAQKKIDKLDEKIAKEKVDVLEETTSKSKEKVDESIESLAENSDYESVDALDAKQSSLIADQLIEEAEETKDPEKKAELLEKAQHEQNKAIEKAEAEKANRQAKILIGDITQSQNLKNIKNEEDPARTKSDIEQDQVTISKQILNIENAIASIDAKLPKLNDRKSLALQETRDELVSLRRELKDQQTENEEQLAQIEEQQKADENQGIEENAIEEPVTYKEEVELAQTEEYEELSKAVNRLEQKQYELNVKEEQLEELQNDLQEQMEAVADPENPTDDEKEAITASLKALDTKKGEVNTLREEVKTAQQSVNERLPADEVERKKYENMLARDVAPIKEIPSLPVMSTGLVMGSSDEIKYDDENPIPITEEKPGGLVYRVQIGAFSKPVPNETFNDFSPVSGEQVRPGLIRYMAGFFGSRNTATDARDQIRELGYNDAFVVAYCDGERIPVYRAQQLLESGACVPQIDTPDNAIVSVEDSDGQTQGGFEKELDEFAYNKAPGAAEADVAESKMGLYYTVQVGVYNTPVSAEELFNVSPLITKRLENGQIRYSSGIFDDVPSAREKQQKVIEKGISDAFIVAYYKGERITVSEARTLIEEQGEDILENKNPTEVKRNKVTSKTALPDITREPYLKNKTRSLQLESDQRYTSYPTQILNNYNDEFPIFYFDSISGKIKSFVLREDNIPEGMDTTTYSKRYYYRNYPIKDQKAIHAKDALANTDKEIHHLRISIPQENISADIMDMIWNAPARKEIHSKDGVVSVHFISLGNKKLLTKIALQFGALGIDNITRNTTSFQSN